ncbi:MAG TPA: RNA 2',3'-cyclic phosphodiesterase [Solirubrobacteraceae bacterium]|nr:RNA 2',3'-cyclic phosphodiesterase [Solirubrobacteraceae bacterium]
MSDVTGETTLRLFVALELPEAVRHALRGWAASELSQLERLRLLDDAALHVTLCFIGATPASELDAIGAACREAAAGHRRLRLALGSVLALPRRRPRVVAVSVVAADDEAEPGVAEGDAAELAGLQEALSAQLAAGGWYRREARPFLAHLTVARVRSHSRIDARALDRVRPIEASPFVADTVTLFRSRTRPSGAEYEPLTRVPLHGRPLTGRPRGAELLHGGRAFSPTNRFRP